MSSSATSPSRMPRRSAERTTSSADSNVSSSAGATWTSRVASVGHRSNAMLSINTSASTPGREAASSCAMPPPVECPIGATRSMPR